MDQNYAEVSSGIIYAGTRLIAIRKPEQPAKTEDIVLTYIPKQTVDRSRSSAKQRYEQRIKADHSSAPSQDAQNIIDDDANFDDDDEEKPKDTKIALQENPEEVTKIKFKSCKLDMS